FADAPSIDAVFRRTGVETNARSDTEKNTPPSTNGPGPTLRRTLLLSAVAHAPAAAPGDAAASTDGLPHAVPRASWATRRVMRRSPLQHAAVAHDGQRHRPRGPGGCLLQPARRSCRPHEDETVK